jgi:mannose-1-phosphate guanylyltransferase/mannose-6-phosphate isomerase
LTRVVRPEDIFIIAPADYRDVIASQMSSLFNTPFANLIPEPAPRNTAPAIALAAAYLRDERNLPPDELLLVCPADHYIEPAERFASLVKDAAEHYPGTIITFGIDPLRPETGYGYLELSDSTDGCFHKVSAFIEKPDAAAAARFVASGRHCWNAGIFMFSLKTILREFERHAPALHRFIARHTFKDCLEQFAVRKSISIDYAVMEKSDNILCRRLDVDWNDVGSWDALYHLFPKDEKGNVLTGTVITNDLRGSLVMGRDKLIALCGVKDIVVIETDEAILICDRARSQEVKELAQMAASENTQKGAR